jgi:hypothetical protein
MTRRQFAGLTLLAASALAASAPAALAQNGPWRGGDPSYRGNRDPRYRDRGNYPGPQSGAGIVDRAIGNLNSGFGYGYYDRDQRKHREKAIEALYKFRDKWARGKWDNGQLDRAIENIDHLVRSNWGRGADRVGLERDLWALRDFRASGGRNYPPQGYYGNGYGYGR